MSKCPFHTVEGETSLTPPAPKIRADIPPLPERCQDLKIDPRGYPIPFFVDYLPDGNPEFRAMDPVKFGRCLKEGLCWVCGKKLGAYRTFVIGPMCAITRTTAEPPSHRECAIWSAKACPFLSKPQMVRREGDEISKTFIESAGHSIKRNPGVTCLWTTKTFTKFPDHQNRVLLRVGDPDNVQWWSQGRRATDAEIEESIRTGLPALLSVCRSPEEVRDLQTHLEETLLLIARRNDLMAETAIGWTHRRHPVTEYSTRDLHFNGWIGCDKVSPACTNCYAAALDDQRFSKSFLNPDGTPEGSHWGQGAKRHLTSDENLEAAGAMESPGRKGGASNWPSFAPASATSGTRKRTSNGSPTCSGSSRNARTSTGFSSPNGPRTFGHVARPSST